MLRVSRIRTKEGTIREALLSGRNAMLPRELAEDPLARWILSSDQLNSPQLVSKLKAEERGRSSLQPFTRPEYDDVHHWATGETYPPQIKQGSSSYAGEYALLAQIAVEEAVNFYFASLFHLGRVLSCADNRLEVIQRLLDSRNLDVSAERVQRSLGKDVNGIRDSLKQMCSGESQYQSSRRSVALDCWNAWKSNVLRLQELLVFTHTESSLASEEDAGALFVICSRDQEELLEQVGSDGTSFLAVPLASISHRLTIIASSPSVFAEAVASESYWKRVDVRLDILQKSLSKQGLEVREHQEGEKSSGKSFGKRLSKFLLGSTHIISPFFRQGKTANIQLVMHKVTKLFLVDGNRPPFWPAARNEAKRSWVANALHQAKLDAEFLINDFAEKLLHFSAGLADISRASFPLADSDWNACIDSFFNTFWVPSLRSQVPSLGNEQFKMLVLAAARLLGAMGYNVHAATHSDLPPGGGGEERDSDRFRKPFDSL